jgi:hypothetical protein
MLTPEQTKVALEAYIALKNVYAGDTPVMKTLRADLGMFPMYRVDAEGDMFKMTSTVVIPTGDGRYVTIGHPHTVRTLLGLTSEGYCKSPEEAVIATRKSLELDADTARKRLDTVKVEFQRKLAWEHKAFAGAAAKLHNFEQYIAPVGGTNAD